MTSTSKNIENFDFFDFFRKIFREIRFRFFGVFGFPKGRRRLKLGQKRDLDVPDSFLDPYLA